MITKISPQEAKKIMDNDPSAVIVDVRYEHEYEEGHVPNAKLLTLSEIPEKVSSLLPDLNQLLLVYCRSGNRSKKACEVLDHLGYTNLKDFGGILDWPYEVEK